MIRPSAKAKLPGRHVGAEVASLKATLIVLALALVPLALVAPVVGAAPPALPANVCLSYWYCLPHCLHPSPDNCDCRPECAPEADVHGPAPPRFAVVLP